MLATWVTGVSAGDRLAASVPVAALRRADGAWEPAVALAGPCREPMDVFGGFDAAGQPRAMFVDSGFISAGDYGFPWDSRVRVTRLGGLAAVTSALAPKVTLTAPRRQVLRNAEVRLRVRCAQACDARIFAVVRRKSGADSGLFPQYARLRRGRSLSLSLARERYFDNAGNQLDREGTTVKVHLVVHACDSAGRIARARRTIFVRIPRSRG